MGILSLFGRSKKPDPDGLVLTELKKVGVDLSQPRRIEFFLYFPTQAVADQAALRIREKGFVVEVKPGAPGSGWLCFATKTMVPDLSALREIRHDFNGIAASLHGQYDGWGTPVER